MSPFSIMINTCVLEQRILSNSDLEKPVSGVSSARGHFLPDCGHFWKYPQQKEYIAEISTKYANYLKKLQNNVEIWTHQWQKHLKVALNLLQSQIYLWTFLWFRKTAHGIYFSFFLGLLPLANFPHVHKKLWSCCVIPITPPRLWDIAL